MKLNLRLLRESFESLRPQGDAMVTRFYSALFTRNPGIRLLYPKTDMPSRRTAPGAEARTDAFDPARKFLDARDVLLGFSLAPAHHREAVEELFPETGLVIVQEAGRGSRVDRFLPWAHEFARRRVAEYFRK